MSRNLNAAARLRTDIALCVKLITVINLANNRLDSVPVLLFQLPSLKRLNLSNNKIKALPAVAISERPSSYIEVAEVDPGDEQVTLSGNWNAPLLEELELQKNELTTLPPEVFMMPALVYLNAGFNKLTELPFAMWIAPSLKNLNLEGNEELAQLPFAYQGKRGGRKSREPKR